MVLGAPLVRMHPLGLPIARPFAAVEEVRVAEKRQGRIEDVSLEKVTSEAAPQFCEENEKVGPLRPPDERRGPVVSHRQKGAVVPAETERLNILTAAVSAVIVVA